MYVRASKISARRRSTRDRPLRGTRVLARLIASEMINSSTIILLCVVVFLFRISPYLVCPSKSRSAIDQTFGKQILPSLLLPLLRLCAPVARYDLPRRFLNVVAFVSHTDGVISTP